MASKGWVFAGLLGLAGLGCARGPVYLVEPDDPPRLAAAHTVALAGGEPTIVLSDTYGESGWGGFPGLVLGLLGTQGLHPAGTGEADLWLRAHLLFKQKGGSQAESSREPGGASRGSGRGGGRGGGEGGGGHRRAQGGSRPEGAPSGAGWGVARPSKEVKVVVELVDRASQRLVWAGSVAATLQHPPETPEGQRELDGLVGGLMTRLRGPGGVR